MSLAKHIKISSEQEFVAKFGGAYEHSPWAAQRAWHKLNDGKMKNALDVFNAMRSVVEKASSGEKLKLIRLHPDLADKAKVSEMTFASQAEQSSAGLTHLSEQEYAEFTRLNNAYKEKFRFPFIFAVRGHEKSDILEAFKTRLDNSSEEEFDTAIRQIHVIALRRIEELVE